MAKQPRALPLPDRRTTVEDILNAILPKLAVVERALALSAYAGTEETELVCMSDPGTATDGLRELVGEAISHLDEIRNAGAEILNAELQGADDNVVPFAS